MSWWKRRRRGDALTQINTLLAGIRYRLFVAGPRAANRRFDHAIQDQTVAFFHAFVALHRKLASSWKLFQAAAQFHAQALMAVMLYHVEALAFLKHRREPDVKLVESLAS